MIDSETIFHGNEATFSIRFGGLRYTFRCKRTRAYRLGIRKARTLLIRGKVITAQPSQYWTLNAQRTGWFFYASSRIGPVPVADVFWALAENRYLIESYYGRRLLRWEIVKTTADCYKCGSPVVMKRNFWFDYCGRGAQPGIIKKGKWFFWTPVCHACITKFDAIFRKQKPPFLTGRHLRYLESPEVDRIASEDRSANARWVRQFVAQGHFTAAEFNVLCDQYRNICLRCRKKRPLVADHVIPLSRGGSNDITNIQPLCSKCNGIKCDKSTDYRRKPPVS